MSPRLLAVSVIAICTNVALSSSALAYWGGDGGGSTYTGGHHRSSTSGSGSTSGTGSTAGSTSGSTTGSSSGSSSGSTTGSGTSTSTGGSTSGSTGSTSTSSTIGLLVPAYFDPSADQTDWNTLISAASQAPLMAIMNPNNGPGTSQNSAYTSNVNAINSAGGKVLGYVHTSYGARALATVEQDVDTFFSWYPIKGIFIDEMAGTATSANLAYYEQLAAYIRSKHPNMVIVGNPGGAFAEAFVTNKVADVFVDAEDVESNVNSMAQASWATSFPAATFAEMAIQSTADASETAWLVKNRHIGWVYTTTLPLNPDPYQALPSDFFSEIPAL